MISLVVPAFNESAVLTALYERVTAAAQTWGDTWELIIVDDGSRDDTFEIAGRISAAPGPGGVPTNMPIEVRQLAVDAPQS